MNFLKFGMWLPILTFFASAVAAENRSDSLFSRLDRPATIIAHNAPSSFGKSLDIINRNELVFVPPSEGSPPLQSDVWVVFVQNEAEIASLQPIFKELYHALPDMGEKAASGYMEFKLSSGEPKAASFHFVEKYGTDAEEIVACKAAVAVYSGVTGNTNALDAKKLSKECESLM